MQPYTVGPYTFGTAVSVKTGKPTRPGAFSITSLHVRSEQEVDYVRDTSRQIALEMLEMPGFISWVGVRLGDMMMTVTAWEQEAHPPIHAQRHPSEGHERRLRPGSGGQSDDQRLAPRSHQLNGALLDL